MELNRNNNRRLLFRLAKNNLLSKKLSAMISVLSILLAVLLVSTLSLYLMGQHFAEQQILTKMQHVIYMHVTAEQMDALGDDERVDVSVPYKYSEKDFQAGDAKYHYTFFGSHDGPIETYQLTEGKAPEKYHEIVLDKAFVEALEKASDAEETGLKNDGNSGSAPALENKGKIGSAVTLDTGNGMEKFVITGLTEKTFYTSSYSVYVSREFAEENALMEQIPGEALVRLRDTDGMSYTEFTTLVYQLAADHGISRPNVNPNGKFGESLQKGNSGLYVVLFVAVLLFFAGSLVIYSIFYFSVMSRVRQIGQFQTIGMTPVQVRKMIRREGWLLSAISIPSGLLLSGSIAYFLLPAGWSWKNYGIVCLFAAAAASLTVQFSISRPASFAAKISPVDAAKNTGSEKTGGRRHKKESVSAAINPRNMAASQQVRPTDSVRHLSLPGRRPLSPYTLARQEIRSNRKKWWLTTASLAFGGILFMVASSWNASWDKEAFSRQVLFRKGEYYLSYLYSHTAPSTYGITDMQLTGHLSEELEQRIRQIPHVKDVQTIHTATGVIERNGSTFTQPFYLLTENDTDFFQLDAEGNNTYEYLAEHDAVLIADPALYEQLTGAAFLPGEMLNIRYFDGKEHQIELEVAAVAPESVADPPSGSVDSFFMADVTGKKLWKTMNTVESFTISAEDYEKNGRQVEADLRELISEYDDVSLFTLREQIQEDSGNIRIYQVQIYGLSMFIILFSLFNLVNTLISSFTSRKKELSMLESVGMEQRQLRRMLLWESLLLALPNLMITLTAGSLAGFGFIQYMHRTASYLHYRFPVEAVVLYIAAMIFLPMLISCFCLKEQDRTSLVERIKYQD